MWQAEQLTDKILGCFFKDSSIINPLCLSDGKQATRLLCPVSVLIDLMFTTGFAACNCLPDRPHNPIHHISRQRRRQGRTIHPSPLSPLRGKLISISLA
jgi:hypothetical protein